MKMYYSVVLSSAGVTISEDAKERKDLFELKNFLMYYIVRMKSI